MFHFYFLFLILVVNFFVGCSSNNSSYVLPSWIEENTGFKEPKYIHSVESPQGAIDEKRPGIKGWVIVLNEKDGHGIEIEINKLSLDSASEDFLLVSPWPLTAKFTQIKLFTGSFTSTLKLQIPNTKSFFILYNALESAMPKEMAVKYRRYRLSLEPDSTTTESPVQKNTVFEIQFKGKSPEQYSDDEFLQEVKEALKTIAGRYSLAHNISFNNDIPAGQYSGPELIELKLMWVPRNEMVRFHRVSFCPFEWPERDVCASVEHSIFVSGVILSADQRMKDYELTSEHLKDMWSNKHFPELEELGITVFVLPKTTSTILWWLLITGIIIIGSLVASFVFWKAEKHVESVGTKERAWKKFGEQLESDPDLRTDIPPAQRKESACRRRSKAQRWHPSFRPRKNSTVFEEVKKKPNMKLGKLQRIPSFMYDSKKLKYPAKKTEENGLNGEISFRSESKNSTSELPIKNYYGSLLFGSNAAFENDEGDTVSEV